MLVLTQHINKPGYIQVGDVKIRLVKIKGSQVRIGIEAPKDSIIDRYIETPNGDVIKAENYERN